VDTCRLRYVHVPSAGGQPAAGGGYALTFYDIKPGKFGLADNFLTFADNVGGAYNKFNGFDITVNARLRPVTIQGGTSSGNVVEDSCGVVRNHPEFYIFGPWGGTDAFLDTFLGGLGQWPQAFCHRESGWHTNVKGLAVYSVPKIDVLLSGTFRSLPYPGNEFPSVQSQSLGGTVLALNIPGVVNQTSLGRPFGSGNVVEFLNIVQPGALYGDRLNAVDLRVSKILKHGIISKEGRTHVNFDIYNLFNAADVLGENTTYGTSWRKPTLILNGRLIQFSANMTF
jgi:hypothetical protein